MDPKPNPSPLTAHEDADEIREVAFRLVFCPHYDSCLTAAVRQGWSDWTCAACELRHHVPAASAARFAQDRRRED